jgi:hypothetical protein
MMLVKGDHVVLVDGTEGEFLCMAMDQITGKQLVVIMVPCSMRKDLEDNGIREIPRGDLRAKLSMVYSS